MLQLFVIALLFLKALSQDKVIFNYMSESEVLVTADNRIRGARNRTPKDFILGGLFPIHASAEGGGECGEVRLERGLERMEAMLYSIDAINSDSTLLPNLTLGYDIRDTCSAENIGLDETVDLLITGSQLDLESCTRSRNSNGSFVTDTPTSAIIGAAGSRVSVPVASLVRLFATPQVSYASSSALLSNRDRYGFFHRTIPPDNLQARAMIDIVLHFNWTYVSTIYSLNTYGQPGIEAFKSLAEQKGICIDVDRGIEDVFVQTDFDKLANLLLESKANIVVLFTSQDNAQSLFKSIDSLKTQRKFMWIASDSWARSTSVSSDFSHIVSGLIGFVPFTRHLSGFHEYFSNLTINSNTRNPWFPEFFKAVSNSSAGNDSSVPLLNSSYEQGNFVPLVVDSVYTVAHALHNFMLDCEVWFSNNRTCLNPDYSLNGTILLSYIQQSNFTSPTGNKIIFDNEGNVEGIYEILNYHSHGEFQSVGVWNSTLTDTGKSLLELNHSVSFQFGVLEDGTVINNPPESHCTKCKPGHIRREVQSSCCGFCEPCLGQYYSSSLQSENCSKCSDFSWGNNPINGNKECIQLEGSYLKYSHPYSIIIMIVAIVGFLPVIFTIVMYAVNWNSVIVKSSGREQMITLLVGVALSLLSPFFFVSPPGQVICGIQRWMLWTSFSVMFCALFVKVVRVARIFLELKKGSATRVRFTEPKYQILFTLALISVQWVLLIFSTGLFQPDVQRDVRLDTAEPHSTPVLLHTCTAEHTIMLVLSVAYQTLLIILCTILGIISFKYPENFNEAKYIAFCSFSVLVIWVAFVITYFATQTAKEYQGIVLSLAVVMTGYAVFATMFGHKLYLMIARPEASSGKSATGTDGPNALTEITGISRKEIWKGNREESTDNGQNGRVFFLLFYRSDVKVYVS